MCNSLKIPLNPPFSKGETLYSLFGKEGSKGRFME
jgi:hypothetical protein